MTTRYLPNELEYELESTSYVRRPEEFVEEADKIGFKMNKKRWETVKWLASANGFVLHPRHYCDCSSSDCWRRHL